MLGTYKPHITYEAKTQTLTVEKEKNHSVSASVAKITGEGYSEAAQEIIMACDAMIAQESARPITINLVGHSRGADEIIRTLNLLQQKHGDKTFVANVFLIDPVAGPLRSEARKACFYPTIINHIYRVFMIDEDTWYLKHQENIICQSPHKTHCRTYLYPGKHTSPLRLYADDLKHSGFNQSPQLLTDTLQEFALKHGTVLSSPELGIVKFHTESAPYRHTIERSKPLTYTQKLQLYSSAVSDRKSDSRNIAKNKENYFLHGTDYFVDKEHQELFQMMFPAYFDYFFQKNAQQFPPDRVEADLNAMKKMQKSSGPFPSDLPDLFPSLKAKGYWVGEEKSLPPPAGLYLVARGTMQYGHSLNPTEDPLLSLIYQIQTVAHFINPDEDINEHIFHILKSDTRARAANSKEFENFCIDELKQFIIHRINNAPNENNKLYWSEILDHNEIRLKSVLTEIERFSREFGLADELKGIRSDLQAAIKADEIKTSHINEVIEVAYKKVEQLIKMTSHTPLKDNIKKMQPYLDRIHYHRSIGPRHSYAKVFSNKLSATLRRMSVGEMSSSEEKEIISVLEKTLSAVHEANLGNSSGILNQLINESMTRLMNARSLRLKGEMAASWVYKEGELEKELRELLVELSLLTKDPIPTVEQNFELARIKVKLNPSMHVHAVSHFRPSTSSSSSSSGSGLSSSTSSSSTKVHKSAPS